MEEAAEVEDQDELGEAPEVAQEPEEPARRLWWVRIFGG